MRRVIERQNPMEIWGNGNDVRDLIYIDDFIDGLLVACAHANTFYTVNICSGEGRTVKWILQTALDIDGYRNADIRFDPSKPSTIPVRLIDNTKAKRELGFAPKVGVEEGMRRTMSWYRSHFKVTRPEESGIH